MSRSEQDRRILIVDDEPDLVALVEFNLRQAGYHCLSASTGGEVRDKVLAHSPCVVILDLNLPDLSGLEVCRRLREDPRTCAVGVLMLTARTTEIDRVVGFERGADDYVVKPFSVRELVLRVDALCRRLRPSAPAEQAVLRRGDIELDRETFTCRVAGRVVVLTPIEFRLLLYLLERPERVVSRDDLLANVWELSTEIETRTVDTHVRRLREKLGRHGDEIETVRGLGYRLR